MANPTGADANANVTAVTGYAMNGNNYVLRTDVPAFTGVRVESASVTLQADGKVSVTQHVTTTARFEGKAKGDLLKIDLARDTTFVLVKGPSKAKPWLIDGWSTQQEASDALVDVR